MPESPPLTRLTSFGTVLSLLLSMLPVVLLAVPAGAVSNTLVINEIDYDQPGTDAAEFIEIKNVSDDDISLEGYAIQLINGTGGGAAQYQLFALPDVTLTSGEYFVLCANACTTGNCDLGVTPDTNMIQNGAPDALALLFNAG